MKPNFKIKGHDHLDTEGKVTGRCAMIKLDLDGMTINCIQKARNIEFMFDKANWLEFRARVDEAMNESR